MELTEVRQKMNKVLEMLGNELATLKTGRANPSLLERVMVEAYETRMSLMELATITASTPNQLVITPFDQTIIRNIEKALSLDRNLGLSVAVDENVIRVNIPSLSEERRQELVKLLHQKLESGRVMIRQVRHEKMIDLKRTFEAKEINEDEHFHWEEDLQKMTDEFNEKIEEIGQKKEAELLSI